MPLVRSNARWRLSCFLHCCWDPLELGGQSSLKRALEVALQGEKMTAVRTYLVTIMVAAVLTWVLPVRFTGWAGVLCHTVSCRIARLPRLAAAGALSSFLASVRMTRRRRTAVVVRRWCVGAQRPRLLQLVSSLVSTVCPTYLRCSSSVGVSRFSATRPKYVQYRDFLSEKKD